MDGSLQAINIVFDGPPTHDGGRFVEVETDDGRSVRVGHWSERPDGYWALRIDDVRISSAEATDRTDRA